MKTFVLALLCALTLPIMAAERTVISQDSLPQAWLTGEGPKTWPTDDVWVFECWATWCGPCVKAIPHMEALWQAVKGSNIHVVGVNLEPQKKPEQLHQFLAKQPVPPTYSIAVDRNGYFSKALNVQGIPHAVVVRKGEVVWTGHPVKLTVELLKSFTAPAPDVNVQPLP